MKPDELQRLDIVWQAEFIANMQVIAEKRKNIGLRLISGSLVDYRRATAHWWNALFAEMHSVGIDLEDHPIYFVSSNTHSIVNLLTGFARRYEESLIRYIEASDYKTLVSEYEELQQEGYHKSMDNFLYYVLKKYLSEDSTDAQSRLVQEERRLGIHRIPSKAGFELETQIIEIGKLHNEWFDVRLGEKHEFVPLIESDAFDF